MTDWRIGTMGYGYRDWIGVFYPDRARPADYLGHYSRVFNAVEMDTTFYGIPTPDRVRHWAEQAPKDFIFCPKTPREISHSGDPGAQTDRMAEFLEAVSIFEGRLGAVLIQFPPEFTSERIASVERLLASLPEDMEFGVEFRNRSWDNDRARGLLKAHGVSWVSAEYVFLPGRLHITAGHAYLRFLGRHGQFKRKNRLQRDVMGILKSWWDALLPHLEHLHTVYAFFNNDFSGFAPATCNAFKEIAGLPVIEPPRAPTQGRMF